MARGVVEHQVDRQRAIDLVRMLRIDLRAQCIFDAPHDLRQKAPAQQAPISRVGRVDDAGCDIQAVAEARAGRVEIEIAMLRKIARAIQYAPDLRRLRRLVVRVDSCGERGCLFRDRVQVAAIVVEAHRQRARQPDQQCDGEQMPGPAHQAKTHLPPDVRPNQMRLRHDHMLEHIAQEVAAAARHRAAVTRLRAGIAAEHSAELALQALQDGFAIRGQYLIRLLGAREVDAAQRVLQLGVVVA